MHPKVGALEGKIEVVTICKWGSKQTFVNFCALYYPYNCWYIRTVNSGVILNTQKCFLYYMSTTRLLFPNPFLPLFFEWGCREARNVRSCRRLFPTDKRSPVHCNSCTYFAKYIDYQVIFLLVCFGEWRLWMWVIILDWWSIFIQRNNDFKKITIWGAAASRKQLFRRRLLSSIAVVVDFICVK